MSNLGGFGGEGYGDPIGGGGGLHLTRAIAVAGQVVRVVFNKAPRTRSPAAGNDGLNGANYAFSITVGTGTQPLPVGTRGVVPYPAFGVTETGEVGIDVQTDRPLVVGLTYIVTVSPRVVATDGDTMGYPYIESFIGAARPARVRQNRAKQGIIDFASGENGLSVVAGDIGTVTGIPSTRLRCMRRTMTVKDSFVHMPGYGIGFDPKAPMSVNRIGALKADLAQQLRREPDVKDAVSSIALDPSRGIVTIDEIVKTKKDQTFTFQVTS